MTYYQVLQLTTTATTKEIKAAYLRLAKLYHPDKNKAVEAAKKFLEIKKAYEVLIDQQQRKVYDTQVGFINPRDNMPEYQVNINGTKGEINIHVHKTPHGVRTAVYVNGRKV